MSSQREIERLNWLGKVVYFAGQGVRLTADLVDSVIDIATEAYEEAERAFRQGLDPRIDDATILEEHTRDGQSKED